MFTMKGCKTMKKEAMIKGEIELDKEEKTYQKDNI